MIYFALGIFSLMVVVVANTIRIYKLERNHNYPNEAELKKMNLYEGSD